MRLAPGFGEELGRGGDGGGGAGDFDPHRIVQELFGDAANLGRHGRGEKQRLPRERDEFADALDVRDETHIEHAVGFVDHKELDAGQQKASAFEMIEQAPRCCDQHVDAAGKFEVLVVERNAADQERNIEFVVGAVSGEAFLDLRREFTRRLENERARHAGAGATLFQQGQHRQRERRGLAGAGLRDAQHVTPREHVWNRLFLNGSGSFVTSRSNG